MRMRSTAQHYSANWFYERIGIAESAFAIFAWPVEHEQEDCGGSSIV